MTSEPSGEKPLATNLILYGPPGTGKTYATAWEAVRICIGDDAASPLRNDREGLMTEYRRLVSQGRIEFITFHQSFSYEDFVEGLRPTTGIGLDEAGGAGFRLEPVAGVFQRISRRAEICLEGAEVVAREKRIIEPITLEGRNAFKISLGQATTSEGDAVLNQSLSQNVVLFGYEWIDWSDSKFRSREEIEIACQSYGPRPDDYNLANSVAQTDLFRNQIDKGDILVVSKGRSEFQAIGEVIGDYEYHPRPEGNYPHRRDVRWHWVDKTGVSICKIYDKQLAIKAISPMPKHRLDIRSLERYMNPGLADVSPKMEHPEHFVLIIDEINRANISKVFGELITLLEVDKRLGCENEVRVRLPYSGTRFGVPSNLHIIGTMNTADRSIALLDTALRRRFTFRELMPDISELRKAMDARELDVENLGGINLSKLLTTINERIEYLFDREHQIGHAYFTECRDRADVEDVMRHKIIPLLAEYFYEDWSKVAAVLGDRAGGADTHFLEAKRLSPPAGLGDDEHDGEKLRWSVKAKFDFSEFDA